MISRIKQWLKDEGLAVQVSVAVLSAVVVIGVLIWLAGLFT